MRVLSLLILVFDKPEVQAECPKFSRGYLDSSGFQRLFVRSAECLAPDFLDTELSVFMQRLQVQEAADRKSTRLNSSHGYISYAVFCLKKKKKKHWRDTMCSVLT